MTDTEQFDSDTDIDGNKIVGATTRRLLEHLVKSLVKDPDSVVIDVKEEGSKIKLFLHVAPSDRGRVIGREGKTAKAIRTVLKAASAKDGVDASLEIISE